MNSHWRSCAARAIGSQRVIAEPLIASTADAETVEHLEHSPEPDPVTVVVPRPVRDIGHRGDSGRRRYYHPRDRLRRVPFLDIDDDPDDEPCALWQCEFGPLADPPKNRAAQTGA